MARAAKRLSARSVETITMPGYHADGDGLYLVVDKSGARRWAFIYHAQGKRREMGLGRMGLKEAREEAHDRRRQIRAGTDPISSRRTARDTRAAIPTFESISREVLAEAQTKSTNDKVRYQWELLLGSRYCGSILQRPVNEITTLDIERVLRPVWRAKPETGRKLLVRLRRVSTACPSAGRRTPITPHGLRATFRTWGEDAGFPRESRCCRDPTGSTRGPIEVAGRPSV